MFEQTFKNVDDILHKDAGRSSELDYVEQTSWILFLKYLDDFEKDKKTSAELAGKTYTPIIEKQYRSNIWAAPKKDGKLDHHTALTGDDLKDFADHKLFPYFKKFKANAENPEAFEYLKNSKNLTTKEADILQKKTFYGKEKKSLAYIIGTMNMILHGVEALNIIHTNTLSENISDIQEKDRYDIVLANPPFGGKERAGVKTVILFFEKDTPTEKVWFYQLNLDRNLGKTNPLNENDLADFVALQKTKAESENSWSIAVKDIDQSTFDLSAKNPNKKEETALRPPKEILEEMKALDEESADILNSILELI